MVESQLPIAKLAGVTLDLVFRPSSIHATYKTSAKLPTLMQDTSNSSHNLCKANEDVRHYLANEYIRTVMGMESYPINLVIGEVDEGFRVWGEDKTMTVPLMSGGEPMAFSVSKAWKKAAFVRSESFADIDEDNFESKKTPVLVDYVVNTSTSIVEYLVPCAEEASSDEGYCWRVVQGEAVEDVKNNLELTLVALRSSVRKFMGKGIIN